MTCTWNGISTPLRNHTELGPGAIVTTGPHSRVDLIFDGLAAVLREQADTRVEIEKTQRIGSGPNEDGDALINVQAGSILGHVKLISSNCSFEIKTTHGVAGIGESADFAIISSMTPRRLSLKYFHRLEWQDYCICIWSEWRMHRNRDSAERRNLGTGGRRCSLHTVHFIR